MIELWCPGHRRPPNRITLDFDDTVDVVHGHQQLSLFNAHYDERCFLPIHVNDADSRHFVAVLLRPGETPSGKEIRGHLPQLIWRIRMHCPKLRITNRGDSHYGRSIHRACRLKQAAKNLAEFPEATSANAARPSATTGVKCR
jgi:hypothetical protein